jgi:hypothetical protein
MKKAYFIILILFVLCMLDLQLVHATDTDTDYADLPAFKILSSPKSWFDTTPVYKDPKLLFYTQEFTYTCTKCHEKDLKSKPKKSHLPFGAHLDMTFTHGLNLRCLNCHHADHPDAFTGHDGSIIPKDNPVLLCRKCHGVTYRDWKAGIHGRINSYWNAKLGPKENLACNQCHNPHHPKFPDLKPMAPPKRHVAQPHKEDSHHE